MKIFVLLFILGSFYSSSVITDFLTEQKKYSRVRAAISEKQSVIDKRLNDHGLKVSNFNLLMVAFKDEDELVVYAKKKSEQKYQQIGVYDICSRSGQLGPKRKQGDSQVPEGFYHIDRFNPASNFYLSLGLNYPNLSDRRKSSTSNPGGDIFIHGACVTIGCLPMTDEKIKELYLYAVHAKNNGQSRIPVYIFPFKMTDDAMNKYAETYLNNSELIDFWKNLKTGYDKFLKEKEDLSFRIAANGDYLF